MTHNQLVLNLLSDGEPHSHHELYDLRVIAHSRVAALRAQGHVIECWQADELYWYRLRGERDVPPFPSVPLAVEESGQLAFGVAA